MSKGQQFKFGELTSSTSPINGGECGMISGVVKTKSRCRLILASLGGNRHRRGDERKHYVGMALDFPRVSNL